MQNEWQSIKTAPKDGNVFLGYIPNAEIYKIVPVRFTNNGSLLSFNGASFSGKATHWMPLPEAPEEGRNPDPYGLKNLSVRESWGGI